MNILYENLLAFHWQDLVMIAIGCVMIFLAIKLINYLFSDSSAE